MFNDKITRKDLDYLDMLYKTAYSAESVTVILKLAL